MMTPNRDLVSIAGLPCSLAGRSGTGLAAVSHPWADMALADDVVPALIRQHGPKECRGLAHLTPFASSEEVYAFVATDEPVEYVGPVYGDGGMRRTRANVLVVSATQDGWVEFVATGPVP